MKRSTNNVEVPSGRGRTDKGQLAEYLKSERLSEGYYVVFSNLHTEKDELFSEDIIQGKRIHTHIIPTQFEQPSRVPVPEELKRTELENRTQTVRQ